MLSRNATVSSIRLQFYRSIFFSRFDAGSPLRRPWFESRAVCKTLSVILLAFATYVLRSPLRPLIPKLNCKLMNSISSSRFVLTQLRPLLYLYTMVCNRFTLTYFKINYLRLFWHFRDSCTNKWDVFHLFCP